MYVWRDKLIPDLLLVHYGGLEFGADFIVEDLEINFVPTVGEAAHDGVVGGQSMFVGPVDIWGTEDCIAAAVEGDGDVLVAAASPDGESPGWCRAWQAGSPLCRACWWRAVRWACGWGLLVHQWLEHPAWQLVKSGLNIWAWAWWSVCLGLSA